MTLRGQVGIVTGAGRGLGRVIATALAAEGMSLVVAARTASELASLALELASEYDVTVVPVPVDLSLPGSADVVLAAAATVGSVDLLVNNAARIESVEVPFWKADPAELWDVVETNLRGPLMLSRAVLPGMVDRGSGRVINLASRARAATRTGTYTGYAVSKRALSLLTDSLAGPLAGTGVTVLDVLPGLVRTDLTLSMPAWSGETAWDDPTMTARVVARVAHGDYDHLHGTVLDAPALETAPGS